MSEKGESNDIDITLSEPLNDEKNGGDEEVKIVKDSSQFSGLSALSDDDSPPYKSSAIQGPLLNPPTFKSYSQQIYEQVHQKANKEGALEILYTIFPILYWLPRYNVRKDLEGDIIAGLTVGVMIVPQALSYAQVAGLPPVYGLYTSLVPIFVYAVMGTSRQLSVGPVAIMSLLLAQAIPTIVKATDTKDYERLAFVAALMVGVINTTLGVFRLGFIVAILSPAVVCGFTSASAIIIFCTQLGSAFGVTIARTNLFYLNIEYVIQVIHTTSWISVVMTVLSVTAVLLLQKWKPLWPWSLLMIIIDTVIAWAIVTHTDANLPITKTVPKGLPPFTPPHCSHDEFLKLLPYGFILALVGFTESISIAKKYAREGGYELNNSQEFLALGIANIFGSITGAYPSTGSFSRTAVKFNTGSNTQISALIVGFIVLFSLLFLTSLFYYIPKAALASVVMVAAVKLFEFERIKEFWKVAKEDFMIFFVTFAVTLGCDVDIGIGVGIGFSLLVNLYKTSRPHTALLGNIGGGNYRDIKRNPERADESNIVIARVDSTLYFANIYYVEDKLHKYLKRLNSEQNPVRAYIIEFSTINDIDYAGAELVKNFHKFLKSKRIALILSGVRGKVGDAFIRTGLVETIGNENFQLTVADAVERAKKIIASTDYSIPIEVPVVFVQPHPIEKLFKRIFMRNTVQVQETKDAEGGQSSDVMEMKF